MLLCFYTICKDVLAWTVSLKSTVENQYLSNFSTNMKFACLVFELYIS